MALEELERRVQTLEDLEQIKRLQARFAQICDEHHYNPEMLAKLFTDDGEFVATNEEGIVRRYKGIDEIRENFAGAGNRITFSVHYFIQPDIKIQGNKADGTWYLWCPATTGDGICVWIASIVETKYEKLNGQWLIAEWEVTTLFRSPHGKSWQ